MFTDSLGTVEFFGADSTPYKVIAEKKIPEDKGRYLVTTQTLNPSGTNFSPISLTIELEKISPRAHGVRIENTRFEKNSFSITDSIEMKNLDKLAKLMLDNPTIEIILYAYTQYSEGPGRRNKEMLTSRRRHAVASYLISRGVSPRRIVADYIACEGVQTKREQTWVDKAEESPENRKVEFKILKF